MHATISTINAGIHLLYISVSDMHVCVPSCTIHTSGSTIIPCCTPTVRSSCSKASVCLTTSFHTPDIIQFLLVVLTSKSVELMEGGAVRRI